MILRRAALGAICAIVLSLGTNGAEAQINLVSNGSFESTSTGGANFQLGYAGNNADDWQNTSYNFLFAAGSADTTGANGQHGLLWLWGPGTGSANGMPASSPDGGNYVAADGDYQAGPISQTISGLTVGELYAVHFWWAAAQQSGYDGVTTETWHVTLGTETHATPIVTNPDHGFIGWMEETMYFTAQNSTDTLVFRAFGTPVGVPPFALLDGVSLVAVPEPGTMLLSLVGLTGLGMVGLRRRRARMAALVVA